MQHRNDKAGHDDGDSVDTDFPKPQASQLEEGTLMLMEDALEERNQKNRRVTDKELPADQERRKTNRRQQDRS